VRAVRGLAAVSVVLLACGANAGHSSAPDEELPALLEMQSDGGAGGMGDVVGLALLRDGSVIVGDAANAQLVRIGTDGQVLQRTGRRGAASGEYSRLQWVGQCGNSLAVHDIALSRVTSLGDSLGAANLRTIPKAFDSRDVAGCLPDGRVVILDDSVTHPPAGVERRSLAVTAFDTRTNKADTLRRFAGNEVNFVQHLGTSIAVPLGKRTYVSVAGNILLVAESDRDSLWRLEEGRWSAVRLEGIPTSRRPTAVDAERARLSLSWAPRTIADKAFAPALLAETATSQVTPRIDGLVTADDGTAWVATQPSANGMRHWLAFNTSGKRMLSTEFTWLFEPRLVHGAHWWGVQRDSIGVESIVRYRVGLPR
jgi:hypothetical protein